MLEHIRKHQEFDALYRKLQTPKSLVKWAFAALQPLKSHRFKISEKTHFGTNFGYWRDIGGMWTRDR